MSAAAGGALSEAHRVAGDMTEVMGLHNRSNNANNSIGGGGDSNSAESKNSRRSLRKREGKSYNEDGFDNLIFDDDNSAPGSPIKGANKKTTRQNSTKSNSNNPKMNDNTTGNSNAVNSNGDVEMESEDDSDDDGPLEPLPVPKELPVDVLEERKTLIRQLQTQLRNEEMSLVLLKKIRQSQVLAEQAKEASKVSIQPAVGQSSHQQRSSHQNSNQQQQQNQHGHRGTPPLNSSNSKAGRLGSSTQPNASGKQPGVKSVLTPDLSHLKPVSVDQAIPGKGLPANLVSLMSKGALGATKLTKEKMEPHQTPAERQQAAKLALRKQLEKTLLQIPPPKPPPPEMHFIPNPTNTEFICLLGLEECVTKILHEDKENSIQPVPFSCSQCGTDFTPTWKWDAKCKGKESSGNVICEQCVTTNVKKALKAEHTNRLKAAFVKALQQEQELEAHMAATAKSEAAAAEAAAARQAAAAANTFSTSSARIASPDSRARNSVDVTVRPASSAHSVTNSRSIPSAHHQTSRTTSAATVERTPSYRNSVSSSSASISRSQAGGNSRSGGNSSSQNNISRSSYNNGGLTGHSGSSRSSANASSRQQAQNNADQAQAAQLLALMQQMGAAGAYGQGMSGQDQQAMALLQTAALQQQMLMAGYGQTGGGSSSGSSGGGRSSSTTAVAGSTSNHTSSGGRSGSGGSSKSSAAAQAAAAASNNAIMEAMMNPMNMYNYQNNATMMATMMAAMAGAGGSASTPTSNSGSSSSAANSAANQMLELQRQAQAQHTLQEMLTPQSLGQLGALWGNKK